MILSDTSLKSLALAGLVSPFIHDNVQGSSIDRPLETPSKLRRPLAIPTNGMTRALSSLTRWHLVNSCWPTPRRRSRSLRVVPPWCCCVLQQRGAGYEHSLAGWCDPSFEGQLTLELRNNLRHHRLALQAGMRLCQLIVHQLDAQAVNHYGLRTTGVTASTNNFSQILTA